jgi:hypothetical protein
MQACSPQILSSTLLERFVATTYALVGVAARVYIVGPTEGQETADAVHLGQILRNAHLWRSHQTEPHVDDKSSPTDHGNQLVRVQQH